MAATSDAFIFTITEDGEYNFKSSGASKDADFSIGYGHSVYLIDGMFDISGTDYNFDKNITLTAGTYTIFMTNNYGNPKGITVDISKVANN